MSHQFYEDKQPAKASKFYFGQEGHPGSGVDEVKPQEKVEYWVLHDIELEHVIHSL